MTLTPEPKSPSFTSFPQLPTELRLKTWSYVYTLTPPTAISFHLHKSDLDYLRLKRKACHNYPHISASRMKQVPPILHVCRESREIGLQHYSLGFEIDRVLSMGRQETDGETYTTCSHELSLGETGREVYWDRDKDVVFLSMESSVEWMEGEKVAYVWGGKTGVWFGRMKRVAMDFSTLLSCGIGEYLGWDGVDQMLVIKPEGLSVEEMEEEGRFSWGGEKVGREEYIELHLRGRNLQGVSVKFEFDDVRTVLDYVGGEGIE
jgi:hypothetical protein